jgi:alpha-galactosidase
MRYPKAARGIVILLGVALMTVSAQAQVSPTKGEIASGKRWLREHLLAPKAQPPFSFVDGGQESETLLRGWRSRRGTESVDPFRTRHTVVWTDPQSGLEVRCEAVEYADYPAVEWTVHLRNTGPRDTPILSDIQGLDARFERTAQGEFTLHGNKGDFCTADSFEPYARTLEPGTEARFAPPGSGKSSDGPEGWPYFNLQSPGGGVILAVGWPGQWAASFARDAATGLQVRAGQELTHLSLKPGEEVRTPLIALLFWSGEDTVRAQNLWRRWFIAHNMPRVDGKTQPAVAQIQVGGAESEIANVQGFLDAGIHVDLCWRDAGGDAASVWFPTNPGPFHAPDPAWLNSGTWDVDKARYPKGFRPFTDWIHARGMQFVLWFEPERVGDPDSWLGRNHPEWLLPNNWLGSILNEGDPAARQWLTDHVSKIIETEGLDWYREDMNGGGPCPAWRAHDAPDRQGMTENLYVQGHLAYWDELRRRHPHLRIDSCASGGRRNDLETMRRAVPLLRSDFQWNDMSGVNEGNQGHTWGLSAWLPFQGTGVYQYEPYAYRSFYLPSFGMGALTPKNRVAQVKAYGECRRVGPLMLGDYYPLTPYSRDLDRWIAWQFNRPEQGDGVIQAFRREGCAEPVVTLRLSGLEPDGLYRINDLDRASRLKVRGRDLMGEGLRVEVGDRPGAAVVLYRRVR